MKDVDVLGRLVVGRFREEGLEYAETLLAGKWKAPGLQKLQRDLSGLDEDQKAIVLRCVRSTLDSAVHSFLVSLRESVEEEEIQLSIGDTDFADLEDDLEGYLFGPEGWIERFSRDGDTSDDD